VVDGGDCADTQALLLATGVLGLCKRVVRFESAEEEQDHESRDVIEGFTDARKQVVAVSGSSSMLDKAEFVVALYMYALSIGHSKADWVFVAESWQAAEALHQVLRARCEKLGMPREVVVGGGYERSKFVAVLGRVDKGRGDRVFVFPTTDDGDASSLRVVLGEMKGDDLTGGAGRGDEFEVKGGATELGVIVHHLMLVG
jgi:hypothetical protein